MLGSDQIFNSAGAALAAGLALTAAVPLVLKERNHKFSGFAEPGASFVWLVFFASSAYLLGGVLGALSSLSSFEAALALFAIMLAAHISARVERHRVARADHPLPPQPPSDEALRRAILDYARTLQGQGKDQAILDLRAATSRILHLMGAHRERVELGRIALRAAQRSRASVEEASILVDDLGWASFEAGDVVAAHEWIREGQQIADTCPARDDPRVKSELARIRVKAARHFAALSAASDLPGALASIDKAEIIARECFEGAEAVALMVDLDAARGYVVAVHLDETRGPGGLVVESDSDFDTTLEVLDAVQGAVRAYEQQGDLERAAKSAAIAVWIVGHLRGTRRKLAAEAELERIRALAIRSVSHLVGRGS